MCGQNGENVIQGNCCWALCACVYLMQLEQRSVACVMHLMQATVVNDVICGSTRRIAMLVMTTMRTFYGMYVYMCVFPCFSTYPPTIHLLVSPESIVSICLLPLCTCRIYVSTNAFNSIYIESYRSYSHSRCLWNHVISQIQFYAGNGIGQCIAKIGHLLAPTFWPSYAWRGYCSLVSKHHSAPLCPRVLDMLRFSTTCWE